MRVHKFIKLFLYFIILNCVVLISAWNIKSEENNYFELSEILINVLQSCSYKFRKAVVKGDADEQIINSMCTSGKIGIILIENLSKTDVKKLYKNKINSFVVTIDESVDELDEILHTFKKSPWWNIMTPYFILSGSKNGCSNAHVVFQTLWKMDILNSYFICLDSQQKPYMYTFNPYAKYAPNQWKLVEEIKNESNHMAIYNRPYIKETICKGLHFDRTKFLSNSEIKIGLCVPQPKADLLPKITEKNQYLLYTHYESRMIEALKEAFKVTIKFDYEIEPSETRLQPYGEFILLRNKTCDFSMCLRSHIVSLGYPESRQIIYSGFSIFSPKQGYRTPLEKIYNFYGPLMIAATIILSTMTYFVIWYVNRPRDCSFAAFEILRLWTGTSLYTKINTLALRIFFFVIFLYFLILQATFQGNLSKFLTRPELRENAESLADLKSSSYEKIYATRTSIKFMADDKILEFKSHETSIVDCIKIVTDNMSSVCVSDYMAFLIMFQRMKVPNNILANNYLSKNLLCNNYFLYATRHDWPLKKKFDHFLTVLEDTGILLKLNSNLTYSLESVLFHDDIAPEFNPIDLESLSFIFYFLIFGLSLATFCFILEKYNFAKNKKKLFI